MIMLQPDIYPDVLCSQVDFYLFKEPIQRSGLEICFVRLQSVSSSSHASLISALLLSEICQNALCVNTKQACAASLA